MHLQAWEGAQRGVLIGLELESSYQGSARSEDGGCISKGDLSVLILLPWEGVVVSWMMSHAMAKVRDKAVA